VTEPLPDCAAIEPTGATGAPAQSSAAAAAVRPHPRTRRRARDRRVARPGRWV